METTYEPVHFEHYVMTRFDPDCEHTIAIAAINAGDAVEAFEKRHGRSGLRPVEIYLLGDALEFPTDTAVGSMAWGYARTTLRNLLTPEGLDALMAVCLGD